MHQAICLACIAAITALLAIGSGGLYLHGASWWVLALAPMGCLTLWGLCAGAFYPSLQWRYSRWQALLAWPVLRGEGR